MIMGREIVITARKEARIFMKRLMISTFLVLGLISFAAAQDIAGDWQGPLTTPMGELRLIIHVTKNPDGTLKGVMDSPDQGMSTAPLDTFVLDGGKVHFTLSVAKGVFDGSLKGGNSIQGYWTQGGGQKMQLVLNKTTTPLKMTHDPAAPSDIDGTWEGIYNVPTASVPEKKQVTFYIKNTADGLTATFDLSEMGAKGWPATEITRKGNSLKIRMKQYNTLVQVKINKTLDNMTGDWIEGDGPARTLSMKKTAGPAADAPKPDAAAPAAPKK
jgi:hypothetical protein